MRKIAATSVLTISCWQLSHQPIAGASVQEPKDVCRYIQFQDQQIIRGSYKTQAWKNVEKQEVLRQINTIHQQFPNILNLASSFAPISVYRLLTYSRIGIVRKDISVNAISADGMLFLSDSFFDDSKNENDRKKSLLHELIHLSDLDFKVAFSNSFQSISNPISLDVRRDLIRKRFFGKSVPWNTKYNWLPIECFNDSEEVLACYCANEALSDTKDLGTTDVLSSFLSPRYKSENFYKTFLAGYSAFISNDFASAIHHFENASAIDDEVIYTHVLLARCLNSIRETGKAECELEKAIALMKSGKLADSEPQYWLAKFFLANIKYHEGKTEEAARLYDELTLSHVYDIRIFLSRSDCEESLGNFKAALLDRYSYYFFQQNLNSANDNWIDYRKDEQYILELVSEVTDDNQFAEQTSQILEGLYKSNKHSARGREYLAKAISALEKSNQAMAAYNQLRIAFLRYLAGKRTIIPLNPAFEEGKDFFTECKILQFLTTANSSETEMKYRQLKNLLDNVGVQTKVLIF